ncbi:MAG: DUF1822 family protein [Coleofasciculus sp. C2-GNP5-27]
MINSTEITENSSIPMPITQESLQIAEAFAQQQPHPQQYEQVYLNTLAVCAVNNYLRILDIPTNLNAGDSWNPAMRLFFDVADLDVTGIGRLECRPLRPPDSPTDTPVCIIPPEVHEDRIGYVIVHIDTQDQQATLLGFTDSVDSEELPLSQLRSLKDLLIHLQHLQEAQTVPKPVQLSQWLDNVFAVGWEKLETLLEFPQDPAFSFRTHSEHSANGVKRGKRLDFQKDSDSVALCIGLKPTHSPQMGISVEVYPTGGQIYLPQELQVILLDEEGKAVIQTETRTTKHIQWRFKADPGDQFSIKLALADVNITEAFVV